MRGDGAEVVLASLLEKSSKFLCCEALDLVHDEKKGFPLRLWDILSGKHRTLELGNQHRTQQSSEIIRQSAGNFHQQEFF